MKKYGYAFVKDPPKMGFPLVVLWPTRGFGPQIGVPLGFPLDPEKGTLKLCDQP